MNGITFCMRPAWSGEICGNHDYRQFGLHHPENRCECKLTGDPCNGIHVRVDCCPMWELLSKESTVAELFDVFPEKCPCVLFGCGCDGKGNLWFNEDLRVLFCDCCGCSWTVGEFVKIIERGKNV